MKNKISVPKQQSVPSLKTDELLALLEASYDESVNSVFDIVDGIGSVLSFLQRALEQEDVMEGDLTVNFRGEDIKLSSPANALAEIIQPLIQRLYKARHQVDETSIRVMIEMGRYKEAHSEVAAS